MTSSDPTRYTSVTAVISGGVPKPGIPRWAGKKVAEALAPYVIDPSLRFPQGPENRSELSLEQVVYFGKEAPWRKRKDAADLGQEVHRAIEAYNLQRPMPAWSLPVRPFMQTFDRFVKEHNVRFEAAEMKVYSRRFGYAGTLDGICWIEGVRGILDIKTSESGIYEEVALQLAAYAHADFCIADPLHPGAKQITPARGRRWYEWHGPPEDELPLPTIAGAWALHLRPSEYSLIPVAIDDEVFEAFLAAMEVDRFASQIAKRVLGKPLLYTGEPSG